MTQTFVCARCKQEFTVECPDDDEECAANIRLFEVTHAVCDDCEHHYLAWTGCHAAF